MNKKAFSLICSACQLKLIINLSSTTFLSTLSRPRGVEHDGDVRPDSSQFFKCCGDEKTAILLFKDRTLGLTGDNKIIFIPEAITTRELDNNFLT